MSSPGFFYGDEDPAEAARTQMMAKLLQGGNQQGPFGGIGQAIQMKALQNRQGQQAYDKAPPAMANLSLPGVNGQPVQSQLSTKLPYMGPQGLSGLFNFGGR